jgi:hypothetical protein
VHIAYTIPLCCACYVPCMRCNTMIERGVRTKHAVLNTKFHLHWSAITTAFCILDHEANKQLKMATYADCAEENVSCATEFDCCDGNSCINGVCRARVSSLISSDALTCIHMSSDACLVTTASLQKELATVSDACITTRRNTGLVTLLCFFLSGSTSHTPR